VAWTARESRPSLFSFEALFSFSFEALFSFEAIAPARAPQSPFLVKLWRIALAFDEQSRSKQRREGVCCPVATLRSFK
jgi:hypothetical protein